MEKMSKNLLYYFDSIDILLKVNRQIASAAGTRVESALLRKYPNILAVIKTSSLSLLPDYSRLILSY